MDFSAYATPTQEWLTFLTHHPSAAHDGASSNCPSTASSLRSASNTARSATSTHLLASTGLDKRIAISTLHIPSTDGHTIPLRVYQCNDKEVKGAVLYFHGGGYLFGNETTDDYVCARIASHTHTFVLSVIYRHTHRHAHPAQVDDAWAASRFIQSYPAFRPAIQRGLVLMGISAGCTLAASVALRALEHENDGANRIRISGMVLCIPWLLHIDNYPFHLFASRGVAAKLQNAEAPVIPSARLALFSSLLGARDPSDRRLNVPLVPDAQLAGWPRTAVLVAGADPLRDDGLMFARRLEGVGVPTKVTVYPGLPHGFRRWSELGATEHFDKRSMEGIVWALSGGKEGRGAEVWSVYGAEE